MKKKCKDDISHSVSYEEWMGWNCFVRRYWINRESDNNRRSSKPCCLRNIVDGNTQGSVRGIHTKTGYPMGKDAMAVGTNTAASGDASFTASFSNIAQGFAQTAIGKFNEASGSIDSAAPHDKAFIIGNGASTDARGNAFYVLFNGDVANAAGMYTTGEGYSEMFEWLDGNVDNEDRTGFFVTLTGRHISIVSSTDQYILGVVSAAPSIVGNAYGCGWQGKFMRDKWGEAIYEWVDIQTETDMIDPQTGKKQTQVKTVRQLRPKINTEFDNSLTYVPRTERPEWAPVVLLGQVIAREDGSCTVDGFCTSDGQGIATHVQGQGQGAYRVLEKLDGNRVRILYRWRH